MCRIIHLPNCLQNKFLRPKGVLPHPREITPGEEWGKRTAPVYPLRQFRQIVSISGKGARFPTRIRYDPSREFFYPIGIEGACGKGFHGAFHGIVWFGQRFVV